MKEEKNIKDKWLHIRLDSEEQQQLQQLFAKTTEKKISRYARKVLLQQPVTVVHRNGSLDQLIAVLVKVQNDLNGVTNNYNQMVHKLHMADNNGELKSWVSYYEKEKKILFESIAEIKAVISEGAKKWLR